MVWGEGKFFVKTAWVYRVKGGFLDEDILSRTNREIRFGSKAWRALLEEKTGDDGRSLGELFGGSS